MTKSMKPRRKPSQSRAWMTTSAIQDAFLIALVENGYERVSMREIANVAGVGLGTLYLYFPNKESIAAVTLRTWLRNLALDIEAAITSTQPRTLRAMADAMVTTDLDRMIEAPKQWRALLLIERRITAPAVYQEMFQDYVCKLANGFATATDLPDGVDPGHLAFLAFSTMTGMIRDTMQVLDAMPEREMLLKAVQGAVWGCIDAIVNDEARTGADIYPLRGR